MGEKLNRYMNLVYDLLKILITLELEPYSQKILFPEGAILFLVTRGEKLRSNHDGGSFVAMIK